MSYVINNSRGQVLAVVPDGTINTSATSISLVGRSVNEYGTAENENYVFLLENFAANIAPVNPILGQLWYNSSTDQISAYDSTNTWMVLASQDYVQAQKISPVFTGVPQAPTAPSGTANSQIATTAFVTLSPAFAGVPTAPTASAGTATTQLATTAFVTSSPVFSGVPTAPTPAPGTATTQLATTAFVTNSVQLAGSPTAPTPTSTDSSTLIATTSFVQAQKASPVFTGSPEAPTAAYGNNSTLIATTAFVQGEKVSPVFTGSPTVPTAANLQADGQIASTLFVKNALLTGDGVLGNMAYQNSGSITVTGGTITGITDLAVADGGTGASTATAARVNLGLGNIAVQNDNAVAITGGTITGITDLALADGGTGASSASGARVNLGLGTISTQNSSAVLITGGTISGVTATGLFTPLAVGDGGTGATTAYNARVNLGVQPVIDSLGTMATQNANIVNITGGSIVGITDLAVADGGTGASDAPTARYNLGITTLFDSLGTMSTQNANSVTITGGAITGIADLAVADGGTGASTAAGALTNLGAVPTTRTVTAGGGLAGGGSLASNITLTIATNSNGYGVRYISTSGPTGGNDGDIWYQI
jgi:hypothetical protein|nr:hypothetical protein [Oxalobacteraceae bacterium]